MKDEQVAQMMETLGGMINTVRYEFAKLPEAQARPALRRLEKELDRQAKRVEHTAANLVYPVTEG